MSQSIKTEALVLYSMRWSESSKIIHLLTADRGIIKVIARGALRARSSFRGTLEILNHVELVISVKENRGLQILSQADLISPFSNIRDNLESTAVALSMAELLRTLIHENENSQSIFRNTLDILTALNKYEGAHYLVFLIYFLLNISNYLGFGWELSHCRGCEKIPRAFPVTLDPVNGAIYCRECQPGIHGSGVYVSQDQWKLLLRLQTVTPAEIMPMPEQDHPGLRYQPLIDLLISHINYHTEQNLQLRSLKMYIT
jgi:DNA repair protein RecO (recombination protein O)